MAPLLHYDIFSLLFQNHIDFRRTLLATDKYIYVNTNFLSLNKVNIIKPRHGVSCAPE